MKDVIEEIKEAVKALKKSEVANARKVLVLINLAEKVIEIQGVMPMN